MQRTTSARLLQRWGLLEGSVYVEVDSNVDVDIEVDILTPTLVIPDLAKCHGHPVCLRRWKVRMAWTAGKTGRGMRPWPWAPRTLYKASCRGGGTLYKAQVVRSTIREALGRTDRCGTGGAGIGSLTKRD